jgi:hypothetical protein
MSQTKEVSMSPAEHQKHVTEIGRKEIELMPKMLPGQFKEQCERLKAQKSPNSA